MQASESLRQTLDAHGQSHLLHWWDELTGPQRNLLLNQIEQIDFALLERLKSMTTEGHGPSGASDAANRAQPPREIVRQPASDADRETWEAARRRGEQLLRDGRVAAVVVAGGQGSRLGFDKPKGMFPIGPVSDRTLFHVFCEQVAALGRRYGKTIPYLVMTSDATHYETLAFFKQQKFFGLNRDEVFFFQQGSLPSVDDGTGQILLSEKWQVSTSPDGHGGMLKAMRRAGLIDLLRERGIRALYYHQVDNPTAPMCDPALIGFHVDRGSQMTTKVVAKESGAERMGVLVSVDGQTQIIEYSDLPKERAEALADDGSLLLWAGNTAVHVFDCEFLDQITAGEGALPYHLAHKPVPYINEQGELVTPRPDQKNAYKFEQFIFDVLPLTKTALVVEGDRAREFNPVKNAEGKDSPETARAALNRNAREWLEAAGATVAPGINVEIAPSYALDAEEAADKAPRGMRIESDSVLR
jgi:UDP-N-acetylglucosamine/UDP-N-acetylgalactosamine diphosphorylase